MCYTNRTAEFRCRLPHDPVFGRKTAQKFRCRPARKNLANILINNRFRDRKDEPLTLKTRFFPAGRESRLGRPRRYLGLYRPSRTTGLRRVPIPVISISTTSPCLTFSGAPSVPIHTTSPG